MLLVSMNILVLYLRVIDDYTVVAKWISGVTSRDKLSAMALLRGFASKPPTRVQFLKFCLFVA
jgi:hypothetical protein